MSLPVVVYAGDDGVSREVERAEDQERDDAEDAGDGAGEPAGSTDEEGKHG